MADTGNPTVVEILWYVPDCGYTHAPEPGETTIPAHCPDDVKPPTPDTEGSVEP